VPSKRPKALTTAQLREIHTRWGKDRLARVLLWEISRLREVVRLLYRQVCRLTKYSENGDHMTLDSALEEALENEPIVLEEDRKDASGFNPSPQRRWPHMSEEAEARLHDQLNGKDDRELKHKARESR
jgi:hypothetical protein